MNKELVLLAAKSIGYHDFGYWDDRYQCLWDGEGGWFDPLNDNADAFILQVRNKLTVDTDYNGGVAAGSADFSMDDFIEYSVNGDIEFAARLVITRISATIGAKILRHEDI